MNAMPDDKPPHEQFAEDMQRGIERLRAMSPEDRRAWLIDKKFITPDGKLHPQYDHRPAGDEREQQQAG